MNAILQKASDTCSYCMKMCRFSCPVAEAGKNEAFTPFAKIDVLKNFNNYNSSSPETAVDYLSYLCTSCGLCQANCLHNVDVDFALASAREDIINSGRLDSEMTQKISMATTKAGEINSNYDNAVVKNISKKKYIFLADLNSGDKVFIPDYNSPIKRSLKLLKRLERKWASIRILADALNSPFLFYSIGDFPRAKSAMSAILNRCENGVTFIFESEELFYSYSGLAIKLGLLERISPNILLLYNEVDTNIPLARFQFQPASSSLRPSPQAYIKKIKDQQGYTAASPGDNKQRPVNDSYLFKHLFPEMHQNISKDKWDELECQNGDIVCSSYFDYQNLLEFIKGKSKNRIYYLAYLI